MVSASLDQSVIDEIVERVVEVARPDRIILFGSAADGRMATGSDIDLLVITPSLGDARAASIVIRDALREVPYPFDVIVLSTERFEETKLVAGGIAHPAHKYGRVIYAAS